MRANNNFKLFYLSSFSLFFNLSNFYTQSDSLNNWKINGILGTTFSQTYLSN
jgi:hypothetical protein